MPKCNYHPRVHNELLTYSLFRGHPLFQFTTTVEGGVGKGEYATMNLSLYSGDREEDVLENRSRLAKMVGVDKNSLLVPYQTHGTTVLAIDKEFIQQPLAEQERMLHGVDALITREKNICIAITTADCVPLLLYDPINHALGAVHAGWKGTAARIAAKTALAMKQKYGTKANELLVAIGPSISQSIFEVGDEVGDAFTESDFKLPTISYRNTQTHKLHIDLWQANKEQLLDIGIRSDNIHIAEVCTYKSKMFFSARRQGLQSGRMLTGGVLK